MSQDIIFQIQSRDSVFLSLVNKVQLHCRVADKLHSASENMTLNKCK